MNFLAFLVTIGIWRWVADLGGGDYSPNFPAASYGLVPYQAAKFSLYILRQELAVGKGWDGPTAEKIDEKKFMEKRANKLSWEIRNIEPLHWQ